MPQKLLSLGVPLAVVQNEVIALPAKVVRIQSSVAIESSADGTVWSALTGANTTGIETGAAFVRCPTAAAVIVAKGL